MLSLTIFAAAASAATQPAATEAPYARQPENIVMPDRPEVRRFFTEWGFAEAVIDGDRIWLSGVIAGWPRRKPWRTRRKPMTAPSRCWATS